MNKPLTTLLGLLLAATLSACSPSGEPATAPAASTAPAAAEAPAEPASADNAATADASEAPAKDAQPEVGAEVEAVLAAASAAQAAPLVEGRDYRLIRDGQPLVPQAGKIEVAEIFGYTCPACAAFQPVVSAWKRQLADDVNFVYVPAAFGGQWDDFARAFYAAESMNLVERTHDAMYRAIHVEQRVRNADAIAQFYADQAGVQRDAFANAMASFAVNSRMSRAKQFIQRSGVEGTPSLVVAGKYLVLGNARDDQLRIANQLIAQERAAR